MEPEAIKNCIETGLVVDIRGTGPRSENESEDTIDSIALRADMDALPMTENSTFEYKTITTWAHMCGHDGHMATILGVAQMIINNRQNIPSNKLIRLLFQPAEENIGGAKPMIEEGCLNDIDEVYGYHNIPNFDEGDIRVCEGGFFAQCSPVKITVTGRGGHGSTPHKVVDPITCITQIHTALNSILSRNIDNKKNIVFTLTNLHSGSAFNVFPDTAFMEGTIRSYDKDVLEVMKTRIRQLSTAIAEGFNCQVDVDLRDLYPAVVNHAE